MTNNTRTLRLLDRISQVGRFDKNTMVKPSNCLARKVLPWIQKPFWTAQKNTWTHLLENSFRLVDKGCCPKNSKVLDIFYLEHKSPVYFIYSRVWSAWYPAGYIPGWHNSPRSPTGHWAGRRWRTRAHLEKAGLNFFLPFSNFLIL